MQEGRNAFWEKYFDENRGNLAGRPRTFTFFMGSGQAPRQLVREVTEEDEGEFDNK